MVKIYNLLCINKIQLSIWQYLYTEFNYICKDNLFLR